MTTADVESPRRKARWAVAGALVTLLMARALVQAWLYQRGFLSVSADEHTRTLAAAQWALDPGWIPFSASAWLPAGTYLHGVALLAWRELVVVPRALTFLASCLATLALFALGRAALGRSATGLIAAALAAASPWFLWLSGTPMLEMLVLPPLLGALALASRQGERARLAAAGCLALASAFHLSAWPLVEAVVLAAAGTSLYAARCARSEVALRRALRHSLVFALVANVYILVHVAGLWLEGTSLLSVLAEHTDYSRRADGGALERLLYYPRLVARETPMPVALLGLAGALHGALERRARALLPLLSGALSLVGYSAFNLFSAPATAAPGRFSVVFSTLLALYAAHALVAGALAATRRLPFPRSLAAVIIGNGLLLLALPPAIAAEPPNEWRPGTLAAGRALAAWLERVGPEDTALVEVVYWDFQALKVLSQHPSRIVLDREHDERRRTGPSALLLQDDLLEAFMGERQVRLLLLASPQLKARAAAMGARPLQTDGIWTLLALPDPP